MDSASRQPAARGRAVDPDEVADLEARVRELERELSEARAELATLRQQWTNWLALISHDLRGPLTLILGYAQNLLRRRPADAEEGDRDRRELEMIVAGARRVDKMIGQVVDAARLENGLLASEPRDLDLNSIAREEVRLAKRRYPDRTFTMIGTDALPPIYADRRRTAQILASLLSNAALFSPAGADVEIATRDVPDRVIVAVRDPGLGLTPDEQARVFDRAFHSERAREVRREGLGLSLFIARQLARLQGGDLWVESPGPGHGATFSVSFPRLPADFVAVE